MTSRIPSMFSLLSAVLRPHTAQEMFVVFTFPKALYERAVLTQTLSTFKWVKRSKTATRIILCKSLALFRRDLYAAEVEHLASWCQVLVADFSRRQQHGCDPLRTKRATQRLHHLRVEDVWRLLWDAEHFLLRRCWPRTFTPSVIHFNK